MSENENDKFKKSKRIGAWYGKQGTLIIPDHIQDVRLGIDYNFVPVDAGHDRVTETIILTFGLLSRANIQLEDTEQGWQLLTPFGNLTFVRAEFSSCSLAESEENLVFTHESRSPKLYKLPSRNQ